MRHQNRNLHPHRKLLSCALAACLTLGAVPAWAQSTGATLRGQVSAEAAPVSGARVTATNLATGLTRSVQTGTGGGYSLGGLPPGSYRIDVSANGQTSTRNVTLAVGQTATLNLGVEGAAAVAPDATTLETVQVTAPILVETKTSEVATYVTQKQIQALPQNSRNFLAFADVVPGVVFQTGTEGSASLRSGAQLSNGINVYIDGVGQKDYVLKGGITGQDSSRGNPFPQLGIAEYKVITSNYKAEYDQLSSAGITAVTRSGTNEFHGDFFWDYSSEGWREPTPAEQVSGVKTPSKDEQYGVSLGGPILQDRLHFFVAYEAKEYNTPKQVTPGRQYTIDELPEQFQALALATSSAPFKEDLYFGKISWTPGDAHLVELTAKHREEDELTSVGGENTAEYGTLKMGKDTRIDLRHQYNAENWLNDAHLTYEDAVFGPTPASRALGYNLRVLRVGAEDDPINPSDMENILNIGGGSDMQEKGQKGVAFQNDFTFFGWEGHTVKMGVKYKQIDISSMQQNPYNPQFRYDIDRSLTVPYQVLFGAPGVGAGGAVESAAKQFGIYIQDDWEVNEHLTLNLGVRWDYEKDPSFEDHVTPAGLVAALQNYPNINGANAAAAGFDYNDYISNGNNRSSFKDAWQPRLGFSYDLHGDQRHVIFGGAGRAYSRNQFDYLARERYGLAFQSYTYNFDTPGHECGAAQNCVAFDPDYFDPAALAALVAANPNVGSTTYLLDNNIKTPYSDQFSLGIRNTFGMFGHDWNSSVTLLHIVSHDGILFSVGNRREGGAFFPPGRSFGSAPPDNLPGYGRLLLGTNAVETRLNSVLLSLDKPFTGESGWGASLAYTYSDAKENRNNSDTFSFDYPNLDDVAFTEALGIAKHRLVATGIMDVWGFTLSSKLTLASPVAREALNCYTINDLNCYFDPFFVDETIGFKQLDVALQKEWDTGTDLRFRVRADVLNVFNWRNWRDYETWRGVNGEPNARFGERNGNAIDLPTRTFKLTFGISW